MTAKTLPNDLHYDDALNCSDNVLPSDSNRVEHDYEGEEYRRLQDIYDREADEMNGHADPYQSRSHAPFPPKHLRSTFIIPL